MPKTEPESNPGTDLRQQNSENAELIRRVREAEDRTLEYWIEAVVVSAAGSMTVKKLQSSVSWRVTRPLRAARIVQLKVRDTGVRRTFGMVMDRLAQLRQARKRG
jgi:hypothetical protein